MPSQNCYCLSVLETNKLLVNVLIPDSYNEEDSNASVDDEIAEAMKELSAYQSPTKIDEDGKNSITRLFNTSFSESFASHAISYAETTMKVFINYSRDAQISC